MPDERILADCCRDVLRAYRSAVAIRPERHRAPRRIGGPPLARMKAPPTSRLKRAARLALIHLGGDAERPSYSLKEYDHITFGPFLGVSDEGSAAAAIRRAAYASPKMRVASRATPLELGVALDAERLGAVGEVAVGPDEYADVWLECVERLLMTTNVGTRVNVRYFKRPPVVEIAGGGEARAASKAREEIERAIAPFQKTPNGVPRPVTVFVAFDRDARFGWKTKARMLKRLVREIARRGVSTRGVHTIGLSIYVVRSKAGLAYAKRSIDLARAAGIREVMISGAARQAAEKTGSLAGLLHYFPPGLLGPMLRHAAKNGVRLRSSDATDPATISRSVWSALNSTRGMGFHLGKYGAFPLTLEECDWVVSDVQGWYADWSAAPVFFVDQDCVDRKQVDGGRDRIRGLEKWLRMVARNGVKVVLIDTIDKAGGWRLLKTGNDPKGMLGLRQIARLDRMAWSLGVKALWAGGISLPEVYELGKLGVFGIYVTSSAAVSQPVSGVYELDPLLAAVKEPTFGGVFRTKLLLEAGFLAAALAGQQLADEIERHARSYLAAVTSGDRASTAAAERTLVSAAVAGWRLHFAARGVS